MGSEQGLSGQWVARFSWFELVCGEDGKMHMVKCRVCFKVQRRDKLLVPKLDSLIKHSRMRKCTIAKLGVARGQYFICPTNSHVKNDKLFTTRGLDTIVVQRENGGKVEGKKYIQFVAIWHLLKQGCPMTNFERLKWLFQVFKGGKLPPKHWSNSTSWTMVEAMHNIILRATQNVMQKSLFIFVNCDEVTTIDNQSWLFIHVYVTEEWKRVLILLNLQYVVDGTTFDNLTSFIVTNLMEFGGLSETNLANKLVCFGVDGVIVFQGVKNVIIAQIMQKHAPFVSGVHCMPHCTNLTI